FSGSDKLPPETQTGANTAGCLINGKVFLPHQEGLSPALVCNYEFIDEEFYFNIHFSDRRGTDVKAIAVQTRTINLQAGQTYTLDKNTIDNGDFIGGGGQYYISSFLNKNYYTNTIKTGELKITRIDLSNSIISGTFWFDAVNQAGEVVEIREGRFDMEY
ncbi:DUF6252 family protein, partial [Flavobacterium sp. PLA-1-15]|uniref:DUF6252 family protein n=1 Tax=Flavobacterium sp. PLA-1-15 TaxID=3380533 RepID=UPI003B7B32AA